MRRVARDSINPVGTPVELETIRLETDGDDISLKNYGGMHRVLFLFLPTCESCIEMVPRVRQLVMRHPNLKAFGVMLNPAALLDLPQMITRTGGLGFPVGFCAPKKLYAALGMRIPDSATLPVLIFIGPDNRCHGVFKGSEGLSAVTRRIDEWLSSLPLEWSCPGGFLQGRQQCEDERG